MCYPSYGAVRLDSTRPSKGNEKALLYCTLVLYLVQLAQRTTFDFKYFVRVQIKDTKPRGMLKGISGISWHSPLSTFRLQQYHRPQDDTDPKPPQWVWYSGSAEAPDNVGRSLDQWEQVDDVEKSGLRRQRGGPWDDGEKQSPSLERTLRDIEQARAFGFAEYVNIIKWFSSYMRVKTWHGTT